MFRSILAVLGATILHIMERRKAFTFLVMVILYLPEIKYVLYVNTQDNYPKPPYIYIYIYTHTHTQTISNIVSFSVQLDCIKKSNTSFALKSTVHLF
jgi:hypothetical protein